MVKDCEVFRKHSCSKCGIRGHMEVFCHTKPGKQGETMASAEGNLEDNETAYER